MFYLNTLISNYSALANEMFSLSVAYIHVTLTRFPTSFLRQRTPACHPFRLFSVFLNTRPLNMTILNMMSRRIFHLELFRLNYCKKIKVAYKVRCEILLVISIPQHQPTYFGDQYDDFDDDDKYAICTD